jgi:hypothetical protein
MGEFVELAFGPARVLDLGQQRKASGQRDFPWQPSSSSAARHRVRQKPRFES